MPITRSESNNCNQPKVSCLMVTADRKLLMKRAIRCFKNQHYSNRELIVIDDGQQDLAEVLQILPASKLRYIKLSRNPKRTLGKLRNIALREATGTYLIQWDDDDWYHPDRISIQVETLQKGYDACCLSGALMHLNEEPYMNQPYIGHLPDGIPGSIMHRADASIKYPPKRKAEDTVFQKKWMKKKYLQLTDDYSYLFIRCYHGANTWSKQHFLRRIRNNPKDALYYFWYKYICTNEFEHPKFDLSDKEKEAFKMYLQDSRAVNLFS